MKFKGILIIFFALLFLFIIPMSFAESNVTDEIEMANEIEVEPISSDSPNNVYFNSSSLTDGDGSIDNPYNSLTSLRINSDSILHFSEGEYELNTNKNIFNVKIIGQNSENTKINFKNHVLTAYTFGVENITFTNCHIQNSYELNLTNVILENSEANSLDSYGNSYGGAILNIADIIENPTVNINNCTFKENIAEYGGAIYSIGGTVNIEDSTFFHNVADCYGGAIACEYYVNLNIKNTVFEHCMATKNAGGAIYLRESRSNISNSIFRYNQGSFGGAICDLNNTVEILNSTFNSNIAEYCGGAIYKMYGDISLDCSDFVNNNATEGGAILIDNSTLTLTNNDFDGNIAEIGEDVYCIMNINETFSENTMNDFYNSTKLNLNVHSGDYMTFKYTPEIIETIPEYYSLVDEGYCTPVKNQESSGNCWAFTQIAVLESCILKSTGLSLDLSEENMKNVIALFSDYGWNVLTNEGGLDEMGLGYLTSWFGPVLEEDDEFDDYAVLSPLLDSIMHVQDVIFLKRNNALDNNAIKEAILKYGGVGTGIFYDSEYLKYSTSGYYYGGREIANHAVTIVGWNDTYSKDNFLQRPAGDGAWIVKNSWGKSWGDKGYFYVSYYDTKLAEVGRDFISYTFVLDDQERYDKNYQYDIVGMTDLFNTGRTSVWYQNIFYSEGYETLKAFSTYFNTTTDYEAYVYVNNELKSVQVGTSQGGYHTIKLNPYVNLNPNDEFKISIKIKSPRSASFPVSEGFRTNKKTYDSGISFFSYDGRTWYDLYNYTHSFGTHVYSSQVACIKAFTSHYKINASVNITSEDIFYGDNLVVAVELPSDVSGSVNVTVDGQSMAVSLENGIGSAEFSGLAAGSYTVVASFDGDENYNGASADIAVKVNKATPTISVSAENIDYGEELIVNVGLSSDASRRAIVTVDEESKYVSLTNGIGSVKFSGLTAGTHTVTATYKGDTNYDAKAVANTTVKVNKVTPTILVTANNINYGEDLVVDIVLSGDVSRRAVVTVGDESKYVTLTNGGGSVKFGGLAAGTHTIQTSYNGDNNYFKSSINKTVKVAKATPKINVKTNALEYGEDLVVEIQMPKDVTRRVNVTIDGKVSKLVSLKNGTVSVKFNGLEPGKHTIEISYGGDANYFKQNISKTINVNRATPNIVITANDIKVGETLNVNIQCNQDITRRVNISIGNQSKLITVKNGSAIAKFVGLPEGSNIIIVSYDGDTRYKAFRNTTIINVKP